MAAELFELLRFGCKNFIGKSVQLHQNRSEGNCQFLVVSTQGKQIYVLISNILRHVMLLKHDVQSCTVDSEQKLHILTSLGQLLTVSLSNLASEVSDTNLDQDPRVAEISDEYNVAVFSNALAFLAFGKEIFVLCEAFGALHLEIISDSSEIEPSREELKGLQRFNAFQSHNDVEETNTSAMRIQFYILVSFSYKGYDSNSSSVGVLRICDQLYNCLFGRHSNLMNSVILLVVRPGGIIHWLPLCGLPSEADVLDGTSASSISGASVLCNLEQHVIGVFSYAINNSKSTNHGGTLPPKSVLLLIGCQGSILTIHCELRDGVSMPSFQRCIIPGPVVCCDLSSAILFYSTGQDLLHVDLGEQLADAKRNRVVQYLTTKSFDICNVVALSICTGEVVKSGGTDLFVVTSSGCLSKLTIDLGNSLTGDFQDPSQRLSSQLIGIRQLSDEYRTLDKESQMLDVALNQLALAGVVQSQGHHMAQRLSKQSCQQSSAQSNNACFPVHCSTSIQISHSKLHLTAVLRNCSNFVFCKFWTFQVTVSKEHMPAETGMAFPCLSSSCSIDGLSAGESTSVMVELPCNFTSPFLVSPSLILDFQGLLPSSTNLAPLFLPLPSELFNELKLLRPLAQCRMGSMQRDLSKLLQTIADQQPYTSAPQKDCLTTSELKDCRFDICIPDQITQEIEKLDASVKADKGNDCQMLLTYIFESNTFFKDVSFESRTLRAVSSCGHLVTIDVHSSGRANCGGSTVSLQSSHTGLLAQLHLDVTERLKRLSCMRGIQPSFNDKSRKALLKEVEDLLVEFHDGSALDASTFNKVSSLYRSVRSIRL